MEKYMGWQDNNVGGSCRMCARGEEVWSAHGGVRGQVCDGRIKMSRGASRRGIRPKGGARAASPRRSLEDSKKRRVQKFGLFTTGS